MPSISIQVLEGLERGRFYHDLLPPVTIGREEENTIRLNDERVSRFHAKLQEDVGRIILTDLDSTNGTRVNGRTVQIDTTALGVATLLLDGVSYDATILLSRQLLPGQHFIYSPYTGAVWYFTVANDGSIDYDPALDSILSGRGTKKLTFLPPQ